MNKLKSLYITMLLCASAIVSAQDSHPHILVRPESKEIILAKIGAHHWAKRVFDHLVATVDPYVRRHQSNPEWILSRYLMNRAPGKRFTNFYSDSDGTALTGYSGDAPYPTIRVSPHKRPPVTPDGYSYKMPLLEELVPYDTSMQMELVSNGPGGKKEWVSPQTFVEGINGKINELALQAAIIYWLNGKEEYARFAADILNQWARGAFYQFPIQGPCRTGYLSIQTLGDGHYEPMPIIYDFLYEFLRAKQYETYWYETVFERIANTMTFRGFWNNNWFAAQSPAMVFAALSLENQQRRQYYLDFFLTKDTILGSCGHLAMPSVVSKWLTHDGHWKEPGGYHNFPVSSLLIAALALENNGVNVFQRYPALFQSSFALLKYSFPNLIAPSIGDTGPVSQSSQCLEIALLMAQKYNSPTLPQLTSAMNMLIRHKGYKRESADWLGLLSYLPDIPPGSNSYVWPRTGELDFARCYIQRNGQDKETALMCLVQGATYNHNHANGMSLELYGLGSVMGIDPGKGITYEAPMHVNYYAQWAAHNTVVAGAMSGSVPHFKGGGGTKHIGQVELVAMEPRADKTPVSPFNSFTDTRYTDTSTNTSQQRILSIVRTSPTAGYYIDIYRSGHPKSNEYVYHNIGSDLKILDQNRIAVSTKPAEFPISRSPYDPPGFRLISHFKSTGPVRDNMIALFALKENDDDRFVQVLFAGEQQREFYTGSAPRSPTADMPYRNLPTPTVICRQDGEAWNRPFVTIYEPFKGVNNHTVRRIERLAIGNPGEFVALKVYNKDGTEDIVLQANDKGQPHRAAGIQLQGSFGVVKLKKQAVSYIYLGEGKAISTKDYKIECTTANGSAYLFVDRNVLQISCNEQVMLKPGSFKGREIILVDGGTRTRIRASGSGTEPSFRIPAVRDAKIEL